MKAMFAIFDNLGSEYFENRLNRDHFIHDVFEFYTLSKSNCFKKCLQEAFRACFNGFCHNDPGSVCFGNGRSPNVGSP